MSKKKKSLKSKVKKADKPLKKSIPSENPQKEKKQYSRGFFTKPIQDLDNFVKEELTRKIDTRRKQKMFDSNIDTINNYKELVRKESYKLRSNTWAMKRAEKSKDWNEYNELEKQRNKIKRFQDSYKSIISHSQNENRRLKGYDDYVDIYGITNFKIKRSELLESKSPALIIMKKQLKALVKEKKGQFYDALTNAQKRGLEIQMQRIKANMKSLSSGQSIEEILEEDEDDDFSDLIDYLEEDDDAIDSKSGKKKKPDSVGLILYEALPEGTIVIY